MSDERKQELILFLNGLQSRLTDLSTKTKKTLKPFKGYCNFSFEDSALSFFHSNFEASINNSGYHVESSNFEDRSNKTDKSIKVNKKLITEVLDEVLKNNDSKEEIEKILTDLKTYNDNPSKAMNYKMPINGVTFLDVFEKLYLDLSRISKSKKISSIEKKQMEDKKIETIERLIEEIIKVYFNKLKLIDNVAIANAIFDQMLDVLSNDTYMDFNDTKKRYIYEFLILEPKELLNILEIVNYNNQIRRQEALKEPLEDITSKESKEVINTSIKDLKEKKELYEKYFELIANFYDGKDKKAFKKNLINVMNNNKEEELTWILSHFLRNDPKFEPFIDSIESTFGLVTPITKRVIKEPNSMSDIINIFDMYREILSTKGAESEIDCTIVNSVLNDLVERMTWLYNSVLSIKQKTEVALPQLISIKEAISKNKKIIIENEEEYVNSALGVDGTNEETLKIYLLRQILSAKEYNKNLPAKIRLSKARRIKTDTLKVMNERGLEEASKILYRKILNKKDDRELLLILEEVFDSEIENYDGDDRKYYTDLCSLSVDCSSYLRKEQIYYDDSVYEVLDDISQNKIAS